MGSLAYEVCEMRRRSEVKLQYFNSMGNIRKDVRMSVGIGRFGVETGSNHSGKICLK